jgi:hypothetical protein
MAAVIPNADFPIFKVCTKCGLSKSPADFLVGKAHCRPCYNAKRRAHYWHPEIKAIKNEKRRTYSQRSDIAAKRKAFRSRPDIKAKEKQATKQWRSRPEIKERLRQYTAEYSAKPEARVRALFSSARLRAAKKRLPFSLTEEWVSARVIASNACELTGIVFEYGKPPNGWHKNPFAPSIDQIHAGRGYTPDNCRMVVAAINNGLGEWGDEVFAHIASAFLKKRAVSKNRREDRDGQGIFTFNGESG